MKRPIQYGKIKIMKHKISPIVRSLLTIICSFTALLAATAQTGPVIVSQPADQTVEYGTNVSFSVVATGPSLIFQWQKDDEDLRDYNNAAGAQTATLTLVGVGHKDAAGYSVIISNAAGVVTSLVATLTVKSTVVFKEDFEAGLANWIPFSATNGLVESSARNHTPGGSLSAVVTNSEGRMYYNLGVELGGRVNATFWMFDRSNAQSRAYAELRGYPKASCGAPSRCTGVPWPSSRRRSGPSIRTRSPAVRTSPSS